MKQCMNGTEDALIPQITHGVNGGEQGVETALGLAGMELTFSLAALVVLCFAFVAKTVLMLHHFLAAVEQCLLSLMAFSSSSAPPRQQGGDRVTRTDQRDIPHSTPQH